MKRFKKSQNQVAGNYKTFDNWPEDANLGRLKILNEAVSHFSTTLQNLRRFFTSKQ